MNTYARMNRLLREWTPGERAIAVTPIVYPTLALEIPMSATGTVESVTDAGALAIRWDGVVGTAPTSPECVDPWTEEAP